MYPDGLSALEEPKPLWRCNAGMAGVSSAAKGHYRTSSFIDVMQKLSGVSLPSEWFALVTFRLFTWVIHEGPSCSEGQNTPPFGCALPYVCF